MVLIERVLPAFQHPLTAGLNLEGALFSHSDAAQSGSMAGRLLLWIINPISLLCSPLPRRCCKAFRLLFESVEFGMVSSSSVHLVSTSLESSTAGSSGSGTAFCLDYLSCSFTQSQCFYPPNSVPLTPRPSVLLLPPSLAHLPPLSS